MEIHEKPHTSRISSHTRIQHMVFITRSIHYTSPLGLNVIQQII